MATRRDALPVPALALALALALSACGDEPAAPAPTVALRLCTDAEFVAHQDAGGRWTRLTGVQGAYELRAPERLGLALAWPSRSLPYLVVEYMAAAEAAAMHPCTSAPAPVEVEPTVQGVVTGRAADPRQVELAHGPRRFYVVGAESTFRLPPTAEARDLVAALAGPWTDTGSVSDAIILRRDVALAADARVTLDFRGAEAFAPEPRTARFTAPWAYGLVAFLARGSREVVIAAGQAGARDGPPAARTLSLAAIPASRTLPGDLHHLLLADDDRELHLWRRDPGDLVLRLGEPAATPTFTVPATSPYVRIDATVPAQPDYDGSVWLYYDQAHPINSSVSVRVTRGYQGDLAGGWRVPMPDMTGVEGFPAVAGLKPGRVRWTLRVANRQGERFRWVRTPADGDEWREAVAGGLLF